ncbi:MAG: hypothetical protein K0R38_1124 [Polyangiaceae bacterium]|jgi:hypothetical protein|nr:hypothetical protein [Polyangiaceae bacterium]
MPGPELASKNLLEASVPDAARFFERADKELAEQPGLGFRGLYASVPRRLGTAAERPAEAPADLPQARPHWTLTDYARLWLTARALPLLPSAEQPGFVLNLFEAGEIGEQVSALRVLSALPEPERFVETGLQACRTNARDVFEAIVCENAFLAAHFPALNFNQAVMKAIFMEVSIQRIEGLEARITPELRRMAAGYASERRAAGRPVPPDATFLSQPGD